MKNSRVQTVAAAIIVLTGVSISKSIVVPFLLAAFITAVSAGPMFWLQKKGVAKWLAVVTVMFVIGFAASTMIVFVSSSVQQFLGDLPTYETKVRGLLESLTQYLNHKGLETTELQVETLLSPKAVFSMMASVVSNFRLLLTNSFLILLTVGFMLAEASVLPDKLRRISSTEQDLNSRWIQIVNQLQHYMLIKTATSLTTGVLLAVVLSILGVDYAVLWGMLAFAFNYVPTIGSVLAAIPAVMIASVQLGPVSGLWTALGFLVVNVAIGSILEPKFMGDELGLSPLVVFLSMLFWGWILGPAGMILSVPLTIITKVFFEADKSTTWIAVLLGSSDRK